MSFSRGKRPNVTIVADENHNFERVSLNRVENSAHKPSLSVACSLISRSRLNAERHFSFPKFSEQRRQLGVVVQHSMYSFIGRDVSNRNKTGHSHSASASAIV